MGKKKQELVAKSNRLIEASYRLSLVEQQIVLYAVCRCREEEKGLSADEPITIRAADFAAAFGGDPGGNVYGQLKAAMETLFERQATIHDTDPETGKPRVTKTRWISTASYVDGAGHIQLIFAPKVIPYITRLPLTGEHTSYRLEKIGRMSSAHAVRIYELLVQYSKTGKRSIDVAWLKQTLGVENEYQRIVDFKKWVIDPAVKQINEVSDLIVSYEQRKCGRTISNFDFTINAKPEKPDVPNKPRKPKATVVNKDFIEKNARPGETYDQAYRRLLEEHGQQRLDA